VLSRLGLLALVVSASLALTAEPLTSLPFGDVSVEVAFPDLFFDQPVAFAPASDGSGLLFVVEQPGRIIAVDPATGTSSVFLDIRDRVGNTWSEEGLLGLALAPDYAESGNLFVYYSSIAARRSIISRFTLSVNGRPDPASELKILQVDQPRWNHNGGMLAFGPDGYLYIALGDGGTDNDRDGNGQNLGTLLGSILRIDVGASTAGAPYVVPEDNPFFTTPGARPEIWAYGFRNPWRFSFDNVTGDLFVGDVGEGEYEEIDLVVGGGNYGWNKMEGAHCFEAQSCNQVGLEMPIREYSHDNGGCAVVGGYVYRGARVPALTGSYLYTDFCLGQIWALRPGITEPAHVANAGPWVAAFGADLAGEAYILSFDGRVYVLKGDGSPAPALTGATPGVLATPTPTPTATLTPTPTTSPAPSLDPTPTLGPTPTRESAPTSTATPSPTPTLAVPPPTPEPAPSRISNATLGVAIGVVVAAVALVLLLLTNLRGATK
jgi:glucose/arabinose dehydrogenase